MALLAKVGSFDTGIGTAGTTITLSGVPGAKYVKVWTEGFTSGTDSDFANQTIKSSKGVAVSASSRFCVSLQSEHGAADANCDSGQRTDAIAQVIATDGSVDGLLDFDAWVANGDNLDARLIIDNQFSASFHFKYEIIGGTDLTAAEIVSITEPGATGNQTYSTAAQPGLVEFFSAGRADATIAVDSFQMVGAAMPTDGWVLCGGSNNAAATADTNGHYSHDGTCIALMNATMSGIDAYAAVDSFSGSGFVLNWIARTAAARIVYAVVLSGPQFALGDVIALTDTTTDIVESLPFSPKAGTVTGRFNAGFQAAGAVAGTARCSYGAFTSASERACTLWRDADNVATMSCAVGQQADEVYQSTSGSALTALMDVKSIGAADVTFIMDDAETAADIPVLYWVAGNAGAGPLVNSLRLKSKVNSGLAA